MSTRSDATDPDPAAQSEIAALTERMVRLDTMIMGEIERRNMALQEQMTQLRDVVGRVASVGAFECILQNGLGEIAEQLAPLRQMISERNALDADGNTRLAQVRAALARPNFSRENFMISGPRGSRAAATSRRDGR